MKCQNSVRSSRCLTRDSSMMVAEYGHMGLRSNFKLGQTGFTQIFEGIKMESHRDWVPRYTSKDSWWEFGYWPLHEQERQTLVCSSQIKPWFGMYEEEQPSKCLYHISYGWWGWARKTSLSPPSIHYWPFQGGGFDVVSGSCFGVRVSVMFHFMFVHYTFSSVWVWPPLGK